MNTNWLKYKKVVLTGNSEEKKEYYSDIVENAGGFIYGKVNKDTDIVVWNPYFDHETVKLITAQEYNNKGYNITIYTENEFEDKLKGNEVKLSTVQSRNTHQFVREFTANVDADKIEEYLNNHSLAEKLSQEYLLDLLEEYWKQDILKPYEWHKKIIKLNDMSAEVYLLTAEYFSRIGDYKVAGTLLNNLKTLVSNNDVNCIKYSKSLVVKKINDLIDKNNYYQTTKPYWPVKESRRDVIKEIYNQKGIDYSKLLVNNDYKLRNEYTKRIKDIEDEYKSPDYLTNSDNKYTLFVSDTGVNVKGMSKVTVNQIFNAGLLSSFADIYKLDEHEDALNSIFTESTTERLLIAINEARQVTDINLISALRIPYVGVEVAKALLAVYDYKTLFEIAKVIDSAYFSTIDGVGPIASTYFCLWFKDEKNQEMLEELLDEITVVERSKEEKGNKCDGLTFVVTGGLHVFENRNAIHAYIESQGGKISGAVNKDTSYLINNDKESTSSKNKKAKDLGIKIISEDDFVEMFGK